MPPHSLTKFEIQNYYQNEPRINVYARNNLPKKIKNGAYTINLDQYADVGTDLVALFCKEAKSFISIVLVLSMFLKKLKALLEMKTL